MYWERRGDTSSPNRDWLSRHRWRFIWNPFTACSDITESLGRGKPVLCIRIRIQWGPLIRIRIRNPVPDPREKNGPEKNQLINFIFWSVECSPFRVEGVSCSLDGLNGGLFCILEEKNVSRIFSGTGLGFAWSVGSGSEYVFNESGSTTLPETACNKVQALLPKQRFFAVSVGRVANK